MPKSPLQHSGSLLLAALSFSYSLYIRTKYSTYRQRPARLYDLKPYAGTDQCELPHVALVTAGALRVVLSDGSQEDFSAGDVMLLPPGHDAWTVGDQACTFVEFSKGNDYYT